MKAAKKSILREVVKKYQAGERSFKYMDIRRTVIANENLNSSIITNEGKNFIFLNKNYKKYFKKILFIIYLENLNCDSIENINQEKIEDTNLNIISYQNAIQENNYNNCYKLFFKEFQFKKKLFSKKEYPMFNYDMKKKITDYGLVINFKK